MKARNHTNLWIDTIGLSLFFLTVVLKSVRFCFPLSENMSSLLYKLCPVIYLLFFALWIFSLKWRVVQKQIRTCLILTAAMELLWILIRTVKYGFFLGGTAARYGWYLYYFPLLMIPALCLLLALAIGKPEDYRFPKWLFLLPLTSFLSFLWVLTNDLHRTVFLIPPGPDGVKVGVYSYGAGYILVMTYAAICAAASFVIIFSKCRVPNRRSLYLLPLVPFAVGVLVGFGYVRGKEVLFGFYKVDITVFICFMTTFTLEACIRCGLILTNTGYNELFRMSSIRAVIVDDRYVPLIASDTYREIPAADMREAAKAPVALDGGIRLSSAPVKRGHILWQDDLSELNSVLSRLSETNDFLQGKSQVIRETYDYQKREQQLTEKNRLYNRILTQTKSEIEQYSELIEQLAEETDTQKLRRLAIKIAFVSAFIKRRDNLVFLGEADETISPAELFYCIEESLSNLKLGGAECYCSTDLKNPLEFDLISRLYEQFYRITYHLIDCISSVCVYLIEELGRATVVMRVFCGEDDSLSCLCGDNIQVSRENEEWVVRICG